MASQINIEKTVFDKNQYYRFIDNKFKFFINQDAAEEEIVFTIEDFFELYEQVFYQIPKEGDTDSHRFILEKEAEYLGVIISQDDIQALLDEITSLRQQVLDLQTAMSELNKVSR
jgi:hypothetical protein